MRLLHTAPTGHNLVCDQNQQSWFGEYLTNPEGVLSATRTLHDQNQWNWFRKYLMNFVRGSKYN